MAWLSLWKFSFFLRIFLPYSKFFIQSSLQIFYSWLKMIYYNNMFYNKSLLVVELVYFLKIYNIFLLCAFFNTIFLQNNGNYSVSRSIYTKY